MRRLLFTAALVLAAAKSPAAEDLFSSKVAPIFESRCLGCHSDSKRKGKLSMSSRAALLKGGRKGPALVPGDPAASRLITLVASKDGKAAMPKNREPLSAAEVDILKQWIQAGAPWPEGVALSRAIPFEVLVRGAGVCLAIAEGKGKMNKKYAIREKR